MKAQLLLAPLLVLVHLALGNPDYIVCSGYVNTLSDSQNAHFDLSQIKISLYYDGILKDTTTCNPDGSYMLSIDERQKKPFKLVPEGPTAAVFDPPYKVIDPAKNISLCKANIIFVFLGFTFPGQVKSKYSSMGPAGFPVELCLPNGTPVKSTVTEASGHYKFANVYPGDYLVRAAPSAPFAVDHSAASFPCKVTWSSADACSKKNIVVSGYYIKGRVEKPLAGVVLGVYCMTETLAREYHQSEAQKFAKDMPAVDGFHLMAASQINSVGDFELPNVPAGEYKLVPVLLSNPRHFLIEPSTVDVAVHHSNAIISAAFKVTEFSIRGRVLSPKRTGIDGVRVKVDAKERAKSNAKGEYVLEKMKAGTYILEAESAFYTFEPVTAVIDSSAEALPDVAADRVQVCGKIDVEKSELAKYAGEKRNVMIKAKGGYVEQKMQANENGDFCTEVKMGEYVVTPIVNLDESSFGLYLTPEHYEIKVEGDPIKNLKFSQIKVDVSGRVKCFAQDECKDVTIQLAVAHGEPKTVKVSHNTFSFASVLPGKYKLSIAKPDFCWQETEMSLEIRSQSLKDIEFVQTGYALQYDAEKEVEVRINGKAESVLFKEGRNAHCLAAKGKYQITPMGCYKFAEATLTYDTTSPKVVRLVPEKYLIKGILNVNDASLADISKYVAISVKTTDSTGAVTEDKIAVEPEGQKYIFQFFSKGQVGVQITPYVRVQGESAEANILFYPKSHSVTVKDQCIMGKDAVAFGVNKGLIIRGKVTPAVSNIMVTARDTQDDSVVATATTNEAGEYKLGPLYDDKKYSVTAQKEGYRMTQETENQYNFLAEQLSYLSIKVSENDGTPLAGVIFDLSHSARTYRNNTRTTEEGKAIFEQLISGDYYLKPLLKEYKFNPEQMALKIVQGKHMTVEFKARRVAFSAYGKVQLLNQRPVHNIAVEALCVSCSTPSMETSTTDQEGRFRIRGLQPKQKYALSVRQDSDPTIFRSTPQRIELTVNEADIKDVNFVTLKLVGDVAVSGIVNFEGEKTDFTASVGANVELYTLDNIESPPIHKEELSNLRHFRIEGLKRRDYILKVVPTGQNVYKYNSSVTQLSLAADQDPVLTRISEKHLNLTLYRLEYKTVAASKTQMFTLLAIVGIILAVYYCAPKLHSRDFPAPPPKKDKRAGKK